MGNGLIGCQIHTRANVKIPGRLIKTHRLRLLKHIFQGDLALSSKPNLIGVMRYYSYLEQWILLSRLR